MQGHNLITLSPFNPGNNISQIIDLQNIETLSLHSHISGGKTSMKSEKKNHKI